LRYDVGALLDSIEKTMRDQDAGDQWDDIMDEFREETGLDLRKDVVDSVGDDFTVEFGELMTDIAIRLTVKDEQRLRKVLDKLTALASNEIGRRRRVGAMLEKYAYKGHDITVFKMMAPVPIAPAFIIENGRMTVTLSPQTMKKLINRGRPAESVLATADFRNVRRHVAPKPSLMLYGYGGSKRMWEMVCGIYAYYAQLLNGVPGVPENSLGAKFPTVEAILPHLFGGIITITRDDEGLLIERYGPIAQY
jgi:hypothetical protein